MLKYAIKTEIGKFHQKFGLLTTKQHIFTIYFPVPGAWSGGYRGGDPGDGPWRGEHWDDQGDGKMIIGDGFLLFILGVWPGHQGLVPRRGNFCEKRFADPRMGSKNLWPLDPWIWGKHQNDTKTQYLFIQII